MRAYQAAGVTGIPRTSQAQWSWGTRIPASQVRPGDLVFFAGADGTPASPGHVGIVARPGRMIEAYAAGVPIRATSYGRPSSPPGDQNPIGFSRPAAHAGARR
jgi:cell wall-associated NlpC family hydrolase